MITSSKNYMAVPPGETIKEQMLFHGLTRKTFAEKMDMPEDLTNDLIEGKTLLTESMATQLETVFGVPAKFWNQLEAVYRRNLFKAESERGVS